MTDPNMCHDRSAARRSALSRRGRRAALGALALVVIASGCGGGSAKPSAGADGQAPASSTAAAGPARADASGPKSGPATAACQLLSEGDVTAAMRQPMKGSGNGGAVCAYSATADPSVLLYVQLFPSPAAMATNTEIKSSSEPIAGLGDDAFWNSALDVVFVQKGDRGFSVASPSLGSLVADPRASEATMVGLAKIVLRTF